MFDKFAQSSKTKTGAGGTGLGLAICREILSAHGGDITAASNPGGGSCFTFRLPLKSLFDNEDSFESVSHDVIDIGQRAAG